MNIRLKHIYFLTVIQLFISPVFASKPDRLVVPHCSIPHSATVLPSDLPKGDFNSFVIPLKRAGRLFLIEVTIDGQTGNLIFDTGASGLVLNRSYFRNYTVRETLSESGGITGGGSKISNIVVDLIDVSALYYENVMADLADLGHIENQRNVKILGLFGLSLLRDLEVTFDARNSELRLSRIDKDGNCLDKSALYTIYKNTHKIEIRNDIIILKALVGGKMLNLSLDTGAEISLIHNGLPKNVLNTIEIRQKSDIGGSGSNRVQASYGIMNDLEVGDTRFGKMETAVINLSSMCDAYGCIIDGMLGYDFWQKGIYRINLTKQEISFNIGKE